VELRYEERKKMVERNRIKQKNNNNQLKKKKKKLWIEFEIHDQVWNGISVIFLKAKTANSLKGQ
jgi:hypothetical protein